MNERKNAIHAELVAENRQLLQEHGQMRRMAAAQAAEICGLRGEASSCRFFSSFASFSLADADIVSSLWSSRRSGRPG